MIIHQALHGYQNGHQLLANSINIPREISRNLLYISDLSGTSRVDGFESYISGYPIPNFNYYILAKTWYADEMPRPGCVWTHSLFIDIAELGRIKDLYEITNLFARPKNKIYDSYSQKIVFSPSYSSTSVFEDTIVKSISYKLYTNYNKQLYFASSNSKRIENEVFRIWSNQWPRLRRNFTFCTGSLSNRELNGKPFELQVFPQTEFNKFVQINNSVLDLKNNNINNDEWLEVVNDENLREFLWLYGADIKGERKNYIPLVKCYLNIKNSIDVKENIKFFQKVFPKPEDARRLKKLFFTENKDTKFVNRINYNEYEVVNELIIKNNLDTFNISDLEISKRVIQLMKSSDLPQIKKQELFLNAISNEGLENDIWEVFDEISIKGNFVIKILENNYEFLEKAILRNPFIAYNKILWELPSYKQKDLFKAVSKNNVEWEQVIKAMIEAESDECTYKLKDLLQDKFTIILLDYLYKKPENELFGSWESVLRKDINSVLSYVDNYGFNKKIIKIVSKNLHPFDKRFNLIKSDVWLDFISNYSRLIESDKHYEKILIYLFTSCLTNMLKESDKIMSCLFTPIHELAASNKITYYDWLEIKQIYRESYTKKTKKRVFLIFTITIEEDAPDWDKCKILRRLLLNAFISWDWKIIYFSKTVKDYDIFKKIVKYGSTHSEGVKFFTELKQELVYENSAWGSFQKELIDKYL